jgi:hypothetical protein
MRSAGATSTIAPATARIVGSQFVPRNAGGIKAEVDENAEDREVQDNHRDERWILSGMSQRQLLRDPVSHGIPSPVWVSYMLTVPRRRHGFLTFSG